jgi:hypothetical protein
MLTRSAATSPRLEESRKGCSKVSSVASVKMRVPLLEYNMLILGRFIMDLTLSSAIAAARQVKAAKALQIRLMIAVTRAWEFSFIRECGMHGC